MSCINNRCNKREIIPSTYPSEEDSNGSSHTTNKDDSIDEGEPFDTSTIGTFIVLNICSMHY